MKQKDEFKKALEENKIDVINLLLKTEFDPSFDDNFAICFAAEKGYKEIVTLLIKDRRVNPYVSYSKPLWLAAKNGHTQVADLLIFETLGPKRYHRVERIEFEENKRPQQPLLWAIENGFIDIVQLFIEADLSKEGQYDDQDRYDHYQYGYEKISIYQQAYYLAIKCQKLDIVELLLDDDRVFPDEPYQRESPLVLAVKTGNQHLVKLLLKEDRINPSNYSNAAFNKACQLGYGDIVDLLLSNNVKLYHETTEAIESLNYNTRECQHWETYHKITWEGLYLAVENKHIDLVYRLLKHPDAPSLQMVFHWASKTGLTSLVDIILQTQRDEVNPAFSKSLCIREASENGHYDVVRLLLKDGRALPQDLGNQSLRKALKNRHLDVIKLLLQDERVNPSARENRALRVAAKNGDQAIVDALLKCPRLDIKTRGLEAVESALSHKSNSFWPVIELFLKDGRLNLDYLVTIAFSYIDNKYHKSPDPYLFNSYRIGLSLCQNLSWSFEKLFLTLHKHNLKKNDEQILIASKLLNTCGLFRYARPSLPNDVNKEIAQNMIKVCSRQRLQK